tara:strand:+ start:55129 stop:55404 length:276 start_codon:yes stop_codon:yes gene_type:complete
MPDTRVECIRELPLAIKVGDKATVIVVSYKKDTLLCNEVKRNVGTPKEYIQFPKVIAKKGTYKDSFVRKDDGHEIPGSFFHGGYEKWFKKI